MSLHAAILASDENYPEIIRGAFRDAVEDIGFDVAKAALSD